MYMKYCFFNYRVILILCSVFISLCFFTACNKDSPAIQEIAEKNNVTGPIEIMISHSQPLYSPEDLAARALQEKLREYLGDKVVVTVCADHQLGNAQEQLEALQLGQIQIAIQSAEYLSQYIDDFSVLTLPYLFPSDDNLVRSLLADSLETELLSRISLDVHGKDITGLGIWFGGYKFVTFHGNENKQLHSPADFHGLKIAIPEVASLQAYYKYLGAEPFAVDELALYGLLAKQTVDGTEATAQQIVNYNLYEVQKNIVQTYQRVELYVIVANTQWYNALPMEVQQALIQAEAYANEVMDQTLKQQESKDIELIFQVEGMRYQVLNKRQQEVLKDATKDLYVEQIAGDLWKQEFAKRIMEYSVNA